MAEPLCELAVALSPDSGNMPHNMRTVNRQIKEAESTFRLAGAGVESFEKTAAGTEAKRSGVCSTTPFFQNNGASGA